MLITISMFFKVNLKFKTSLEFTFKIISNKGLKIGHILILELMGLIEF
jgi:hypothetical protein